MSLFYLRKNITVTPLRSRPEAIVKIPTPHTPRQCKSFVEL